MNYPGILVIGVLFIGFISNGSLLFYLFFAASAFTSLSVIPPGAAGGLTILPQTLLALFLFARTMLGPGAAVRAARLVDNPERFGLLFAYLAVCFVVTIVAPRLFAGQIVIIPVRLDADFENVALAPTTSNLTQCAYLTVSALAALTMALFALKPGFIDRFAIALLGGGITVIVTGIVDMIFADSGALAPFRNASYSILESATELGMRRVIGLAPEASAYGSNCMFFAATLIFLRPAVARPQVRVAMIVVSLALIGMAVLSTSSTAYLWIASLAVCYAANFAVRCLSPTSDRKTIAAVRAELVMFAALLFAGVLIFAFGDGIYARAYEIIDATVLSKSATESFISRSFWNETSLAAFFSSLGLGVGVGSTRSSNIYIALISNTGVVGAALFALFILQMFLARGRSASANSAIIGLKLTLLSLFLPWGAAGGSPDFGPNIGAIFGAIVGLMAAAPALPQRARRRLIRRAEEPLTPADRSRVYYPPGRTLVAQDAAGRARTD